MTASVASGQPGTLVVTLETRNLSHVDVFLGNRPVRTIDVTDGEAQVSIDAGVRAMTVDLQGYDEGRLAARKRLLLPADD